MGQLKALFWREKNHNRTRILTYYHQIKTPASISSHLSKHLLQREKDVTDLGSGKFLKPKKQKTLTSDVRLCKRSVVGAPGFEPGTSYTLFNGACVHSVL